MAFQAMPDEILHKILGLCLLIPVEEFCNFPSLTRGRASPPPRLRLRRHAHVLLISKRFLRIGTPLLYNSLYLWSDSHLENIAHLLRLDSYIGDAITNLRLESGAFGKGLYTIVGLAPNLKTLFLDMYNIGKTKRTYWGLTEVLKDGLLNPQTLHVVAVGRCDLSWHLCYSLGQWTSLVNPSFYCKLVI